MFKLKKEVRKFFPDDLQEKTMTLLEWNKNNISAFILDRVGRVYVTKGRQDGENSKFISSWYAQDMTAKFGVTVNVDAIDYEEYNNVDFALMMDKIENTLNEFFSHGK